ncbi:MAG: UDP-3-O-(3-hydroxymyristoyl)glucosamine N-acyltransferase [Pyrinomonadaceae bacterium]
MRTREIAAFLQAELVGDENVEILRVAALESATADAIAFYARPTEPMSTAAGCVIVPPEHGGSSGPVLIKSAHPKLDFVRIARILHPSKTDHSHHTSAVYRTTGGGVLADFIGPFAFIADSACIGKGSQIHAGVRVADNVTIGENTIIHPNCVIYNDVQIGSSCIIHAGSVIGADGFGYVRDDLGEYHQFPQVGRVIIEDNVEIGANSCIDRGALGDTRIGYGTKIDNLVQVAHNVSIGRRVIIAAQTGISGSTVIEDDCVIGGQVGMGDHARVLSGAIIGSQAGILPGKIVRPGIWWGTPVQPLDEYKRQNALVRGLSRLKEDVKDLKSQLSKNKP